MRVTCPSCEEVLDLAGFRIPPEGRLMACPVCEHMWKARPPEGPDIDPLAEHPALSLAPPEEESRPLPPRPAPPKKSRRLLIVGIAVVLIAALGGGGAYYMMPAPAPVIDVPLRVAAPQFSGRVEEGILTIGFEVENKSSFAKPLSRACIALRGKDDIELFGWCERLSAEIPAGGSHQAQLRLANPPAGVVAVAINVN